MKRLSALSGILVLAILLMGSIASADKLAPPQNKLQPLPPEVQPAISESVQRTASPQDMVNIEQAASSEPAPDSNIAPTNAPSGSGVPTAFEIFMIALTVLVVVGVGGTWLWKSF